MSNQSNTCKRTSIMDMFSEGPSSEEINSLKEFLDLLRQEFDLKLDDSERLVKRKNLDIKLDDEYINDNVKKLFDTCLERVASNSNTNFTNRKSDLAIKILETLGSYNDQIENFDQVTPNIVKILDKAFFDKMTQLFKTTSPEFTLKIVKMIIEILGKSLHNNLSIINPLLQIMELGFKHSNNQIKSQSYDCWQNLIRNFALDRTFFLKPKKFTLVLMPLLNKCKTFKDECVCKAKCLAWMCLIENLKEQLPNYAQKVLLPFFNFCFGLNSFMVEKEIFFEGEEDNEEKSENVKKLLIAKIQSEHDFKSLIQIGSEVLVSIVFNGHVKCEELSKKLTYVGTNLNYGLNELLNDRVTWMFIMKYFFDIFMTQKLNQSNDGLIILETWKQMAKLLHLDVRIDSMVLVDDEDDAIMDSQFQSSKEPEIKKELLKEYKNYFVQNSIDYVNNYVVSTKQGENRFITQLSKLVLSNVKNEYEENYTEQVDMKVNLIKLMKKSANLILATDDDNLNTYMGNLGFLLGIMENNHDLLDLYQWIHITNKFYDYLKSIKTKTNQLNLSEEGFNLVTQCILFPFKYYKVLDILETDIKLVLSSSTNIAKIFSSIIKQNRIKLTNCDDELNINNWCLQFFTHINKQYRKSLDLSLIHDLNSYWSNLHNSLHSTQAQIQQPTSYHFENTCKILQLQTQFALNILQNVYEFDQFNESSTEPLGVFSSTKRPSQTLATDLTDLIHNEINLFYNFIKSQTNQSSLSLNDEEMDCDNKKDSNLEIIDAKHDKENKLPVQIFQTLIEQLSCLFTRIKNNSILKDLLIFFAPTIEFLTELNSLSKTSQETPKTPTPHSHINSHFKYQTEKISLQFHSTRKSSELFDTFSLQISSLIQNTLSKICSTHEFDSNLLEKLEPIFFSFLQFTTKQGLKQKILQAWNSTFGKSTVQLLKYSTRLENLFVEIKEEMIQKKTSNSLVLSLPGFKPLDLLNSNTNNTTNSTFVVQESMSEEKENTPENMKQESNSSISIAHFVFSPAAGRNSFFKQQQQQQSASASKATHTPENKQLRPRPSPRSLNHNSKRKLDLNGLIDQQPDNEFVEINKPEMKSRRSLSLRSKQPLTEHQKEVRKTKSFIPMEVQPIDVDSQMSCSIMDEDTTTQTVNEVIAEKMTDESVKAIFQFKSLKEEKNNEIVKNDDEPVLKFQSKINPTKQIEVIEVKMCEEEEPEQDGDGVKRRSIRLKQKEESSVEDEVEKLGESLLNKIESNNNTKKRSNLDILKLKNNLLKRSKKIANFKPKNAKIARKNLQKYKNLIMKNIDCDTTESKKILKTKKKMEKRQKIKDLNASLNEDEIKSDTVGNDVSVIRDISMQVEDTGDEDDDEPLSTLIEKKKQPEVVEETPVLTEEIKEVVVEAPIEIIDKQTELIKSELVSQTPKLEPVIEDEATDSSKTKKSTDDLLHKLNNTPTTSILKKKLAKMNQSETMINIDLDTPGKRRVSFCEAVQVEEIEPNFNKSIFNRSTPRVQNKAKIVLSPYFGNKNNLGNSPASVVSSPITTNSSQTSTSMILPQVETQKVTTSQSAPSTPNSKLQQQAQNNVQNSPGSASFLDFISTNRIMSQRSSMIQQQMQSKSESPVVNRQQIGLSNSLPVGTPNGTDSPKPLNRTITQMEGLNDYKICEKLKSSKLSIEIMFDKLDTSLYMQKLGSYKYFKYKNILTIGDFSSLSPSEINNLPLKVPKYENYLSLIKCFEEKCQDLLLKEDKKLVSMGSAEEEMEKLESMENMTHLDTSIECEKAKIEMEMDRMDESRCEEKEEDKMTNKVNVNEKFKLIMENMEIEFKNFNSLIANGNLSSKELFVMSRQIDQTRQKMTDLFNSSQDVIRGLIESKLKNQSS
ncbi:unnamed protein product [Brachionus calyciflorus]|uniref:Telomere-associated protein RIF1 n=1 Tax=Brachionus calyciflorus TaxID=104777 RepID=A0A814DHC7_9BILA|nr:unnamed protein product [Brachionus calyciflorus]